MRQQRVDLLRSCAARSADGGSLAGQGVGLRGARLEGVLPPEAGARGVICNALTGRLCREPQRAPVGECARRKAIDGLQNPAGANNHHRGLFLDRTVHAVLRSPLCVSSLPSAKFQARAGARPSRNTRHYLLRKPTGCARRASHFPSPPILFPAPPAVTVSASSTRELGWRNRTGTTLPWFVRFSSAQFTCHDEQVDCV